MSKNQLVWFIKEPSVQPVLEGEGLVLDRFLLLDFPTFCGSLEIKSEFLI